MATKPDVSFTSPYNFVEREFLSEIDVEIWFTPNLDRGELKVEKFKVFDLDSFDVRTDISSQFTAKEVLGVYEDYVEACS